MKNKVFIITGPPGSGKTTFLSNLIKELRDLKIQTGGFLAEGFWSDDARSHFELVDLFSNERILFCTKEPHTGWNKIGHFYVNPSAISFGKKVLNTINISEFPICIIDEVGPYELLGKGWSDAIQRIVKDLPDKPMIWIVRENLVQTVIRHFGIDNYSLIPATSVQLESTVSELVNFLDSAVPPNIMD
jgi:nucleoside-triphosphatase THEP1